MNARVSERDLKSAKALPIPPKGVEALGTAGICIALGVVLPLVIHSLGLSQRAILPMHYPVYLAGVLLSPLYAGMVGILAPALSSGFTGLPTAEQVLRMMPELAVYGLATSFILRLMPVWPGVPQKFGRMAAIAAAMFGAMILGRLAYILGYTIFSGGQSLDYYVAVLVTPAIPGIIAQLILLPLIASRVEKPSAPSVYDRKQGSVKR